MLLLKLLKKSAIQKKNRLSQVANIKKVHNSYHLLVHERTCIREEREKHVIEKERAIKKIGLIILNILEKSRAL
jgi:hypothetical protein